MFGAQAQLCFSMLKKQVEDVTDRAARGIMVDEKKDADLANDESTKIAVKCV